MSKAVNHIGLIVKDLNVSTAFYELLGFNKGVIHGLRLRGPWADKFYGENNCDITVGFVQMGSLLLELVEWNSPDNIKTNTTPVSAVGSAHIAISIDDVPAEFERLKAAGVKFLSSEPVTIPDQGFGTGDLTAVFGIDPDGNNIELINLPM